MTTTTDAPAVASTDRPTTLRRVSAVPYLPGLDGLRAVAVVAVMVYHANASWLPGGFLGVEVFFVISGYLITLLLIGEHERSGRVRVRQFYVATGPAAAAGAVHDARPAHRRTRPCSGRDALGQLRGDVIAGLTYVSNWYQIWIGQGYTATGDFAPLRHLWSLAVEEQFYLLWPLVMIVILRRGSRRVQDVSWWLVVTAIAIAAVVALLYQPGPIGPCAVTPDAYWQVGERCFSKVDVLYLSTPTRAGGLLLGAALAMVWRPVALMRGPMRRRGRRAGRRRRARAGGPRRADLAAARLDAGRRRPVAVPRRVRADGARHAGRDRRRDPPGDVDRPGARQHAVRVDRHPQLRAVPVPLADLPGHPARRREHADASPSSPWRWPPRSS